MKISRFISGALALCSAVVIVSCSDISPVAPTSNLQKAEAAQQSTLLGGLTNSLLSCAPLPAASVTQTIGPAGGTINIGPHKLVIPAGALSRNTTIKASIKSEKVNRVHFEPDGLKFDKQATLTMSYANCGLVSSLLPKRIAYVSPTLSILEHLLSLDDILGKKVTAKLSHFSDYAVEEMAFSDHMDWW